MRLKFLRTTNSQAPDVPFQAGQIVHLTKLTPEARAWVKAGDAVVLEDEIEAAMLGAPSEVAVRPDAKPRGSR